MFADQPPVLPVDPEALQDADGGDRGRPRRRRDHPGRRRQISPDDEGIRYRYTVG